MPKISVNSDRPAEEEALSKRYAHALREGGCVRERERETDRQTDRQTETERYKGKERDRDRESARARERGWEVWGV